MLPLIDIGPLRVRSNHRKNTANEIGIACRDTGFFSIKNHGVDEKLQDDLERLSRKFFDFPVEEKMRISMSCGGRAWRGYFPVGGELTSGKPDQKEGIYFGEELPGHHPMVKKGTSLHGKNLFPTFLPELKTAVLKYMDEMKTLGQVVMSGIALSLDLPDDYFSSGITKDPLCLFRIFNYPAGDPRSENWGVGEHTDYGVLTILRQDDIGGLEVKSKKGWVPVPPVKNTFVCNIGDMLDKMTGGNYRSTPHRVKNESNRSRLSFPFFFDPNFNAKISPLIMAPHDDKTERWDKASVHEFKGTYGDYLLAKVSKVFPDLKKETKI